LELNPHTLWFSSAAASSAPPVAPRRKAEQVDVMRAIATIGTQARYSELRHAIMTLTACSKRTAQLAIHEACRQGRIVQADGRYRLPL